MSQHSKYTTAQLCDKYDDLSKQVKMHTVEMETMNDKIHQGNEKSLEANKNLDDLITQVRYKTIQLFKEVFGDPDSGRRGLAKSHRASDEKIDDIFKMITSAKTVLKVTYLIGGSLIVLFAGAVYNGKITLQFLQP